jgi:hypothetical protein
MIAPAAPFALSMMYMYFLCVCMCVAHARARVGVGGVGVCTRARACVACTRVHEWVCAHVCAGCLHVCCVSSTCAQRWMAANTLKFLLTCLRTHSGSGAKAP